MRYLYGHQVNECNEAIDIRVMDEPGSGGAHHEYEIDVAAKDSTHLVTCISFQNGPIKEVGTNGITEQALIAVLLDRMRAFQSGPYSCRENAIALTNLEQCEMWLHQRTRNRLARGVEGTHSV